MSDVDLEISNWCDEQIGNWGNSQLEYEQLHADQQALCRSDPTISMLLIEGRSVVVSQLNKSAPPAIVARTRLYRDFISTVLQEIGPIERRIALCLDTSDEPPDRVTLPVFGFQKHVGYKNLLLPDVDFFYHDFYSSPEYQDAVRYLEKARSAVFVGSTTGGGEVSRAKIAAGQVPRIDAALFFAGSPVVDFRLPRLVQTDTQDTNDWLRQQGFGTGEMSWAEQFKHRFILSLDGNGAACSRLFVGLRSNSVVMKYDSPSQLFYMQSLKPWTHFVPIQSNRDVLTAVERDRDEPSVFQTIAEQSRTFCDTFLNRLALQRYTHTLLSRYGSLVNGPARQTSLPAISRSALAVSDSPPSTRNCAITSSIPDHLGLDYRQVIHHIHQWLKPNSYLEVGVEKGETFILSDSKSIGVDVAFQFTSTDLLQKISQRPMSALYRMPSDSFFKSFDPTKILGGPVELAFLDGMHQCEYLLRDFINTEKSCLSNSIIILHDCCPLETPMAAREPGQHAIEAHREGWWTGDVWRTALALKRLRTDLQMVVLDAAPTGLVCITNLNPASTYLQEEYFTVVDAMRAWDLEQIGLGALLMELEILSTDCVGTPEKMHVTLR